MEKQYVQYGCGFSSPSQWLNFDISPTLRIQKTPILGTLLKSRLNVIFPDGVRYGDIIKGLPNIQANSCDGVYCSHTLEHLSLKDLRTALVNTHKILKPGGIFRLVVPDLEFCAKEYLKQLANGDSNASNNFVGKSGTILGTEARERGLKSILTAVLGNARHLWMWDYISLQAELNKAGFTAIRRCQFNDSSDPMFQYVESEDRFKNALAIECKK